MSVVDRLEEYFGAMLGVLHKRLCHETQGMMVDEALLDARAFAGEWFAAFALRERFLKSWRLDAGEAVNPPGLAAHGCICLVVNYEIHGVPKLYESRLYVPEAPPGWPMLPQDQG